jgi:hypothetical protein
MLLPVAGLFALVEFRTPDGAARRALEFLATLVLFAVMAAWVRTNRIPLEIAGDRRRSLRRVVPTAGASPDGTSRPTARDSRVMRARAGRASQLVVLPSRGSEGRVVRPIELAHVLQYPRRTLEERHE